MRSTGIRAFIRALALVYLASTGIVAAQVAGAPKPAPDEATHGQILTINPEALFAQSAFGRRVSSELASRSQVLADENARIEAELKGEEQTLTDQRPSLLPELFRQKADAFDQKVEEIRARQAQKNLDLNAWVESERQRFFGSIFPALLGLTRELGASVILDRRSVFLATENIDVTLQAIARVDAALGDGDVRPKPETSP